MILNDIRFKCKLFRRKLTFYQEKMLDMYFRFEEKYIRIKKIIWAEFIYDRL